MRICNFLRVPAGFLRFPANIIVFACWNFGPEKKCLAPPPPHRHSLSTLLRLFLGYPPPPLFSIHADPPATSSDASSFSPRPRTEKNKKISETSTKFFILHRKSACPNPDLPILVFFRFPRFFRFAVFLAFFVVFCSLFQGFQGFSREENPCFFLESSFFFLCHKGKVWKVREMPCFLGKGPLRRESARSSENPRLGSGLSL